MSGAPHCSLADFRLQDSAMSIVEMCGAFLRLPAHKSRCCRALRCCYICIRPWKVGLPAASRSNQHDMGIVADELSVHVSTRHRLTDTRVTPEACSSVYVVF